MRILIASCDKRKPLWPIWEACWKYFWPDCKYQHSFISDTPDSDFSTIPTGTHQNWNRRLLAATESVPDELVTLCLDDDFLAPPSVDEITKIPKWAFTPSFDRCLEQFHHSNVGSIGISPAHDPESIWTPWPRLGVIDREHHPFKRTTLSSIRIYRKTVLQRLLNDVDQKLSRMAPQESLGWLGAVNFEVFSCLASEDVSRYPEEFLAVRRSEHPILHVYGGCSIRGGKMLDEHGERDILKTVGIDLEKIPGIQGFL